MYSRLSTLRVLAQRSASAISILIMLNNTALYPRLKDFFLSYDKKDFFQS